jgi:hypothetical protein
MAKAGADPSAFERRLKDRLERRLVGQRRFQAKDNDGVRVEEVRLEGAYPDTTVSIRPLCRLTARTARWGFAETTLRPG